MAKPKGTANKNSDRLLSLICRIERLEEEKKALSTDIKEIYVEAKSAGFDAKYVRAMIRERAMSEADREEERALLDIYRAAIGILDGTPLGDAARRRLKGKADVDEAPSTPPSDDAAAGTEDRPAEASAILPPTPDDLLAAKAEGSVAAKAGRKVTENPHPAGSPLRGAWDEGWCAGSASDGMDIPDAWRRTKPKTDKPGKGA